MKVTRMNLALQKCLLLSLVCVVASGCASWSDVSPAAIVKKVDIPDGIPWKAKEDEVRRGAPRRMVVTWTDTVKQTPGMDAERGFGGRVFFYDTEESKPIGVKGQLVVYAFDESDRLPTDNKPNKRYVFPAEQFAKHESMSEFGVSYSVWLPWDKVGGAETDVSLIARFEPTEGGTLIVSDQTRQPLPGRLRNTDAEVRVASQTKGIPTVTRTRGEVQSASYQTPAAEKKSGGLGFESTTIQLPSKSRLGR